MNGWKDFKTDDKTSVMNTGEGEQLAWQLRQWNSRWISESVTTGQSLLIKLPQQHCHGFTYNIAHNDLGYKKVCIRLVPRQLSDDHKRARQSICQEHLDRHAREGDGFLHRNVTGDESWVYHYEPESKRQSMQWKHPSSPANKKFKTGFRWESHSDHRLGCQWPYIGALPGKWSNCDQCSIQCHASVRVEARDTIETPGTSLKKEYCCFTTTPAPIRMRIQWIH